MKPYRQLVAELAELDKRIATARVQARREALEQIASIMYEFDIKPNGLRRPRNIRYATTPTKPVYRDPQTGSTWSGRGHTPNWIKGKDRNAFRIVD